MIQHSQGFLKPFSGGGYRDLLGGFWNEHGYWMASLWATLGSTALDAGISVSSLVNFCLSELLVEELQLLVRLHHPKWWSWPCLPPALRKQQLLVHSQPAGAAPLAFLNAGRVESFFTGHCSWDFLLSATNQYPWSYLEDLQLKYNCRCVVLHSPLQISLETM